MSEPVIPIERIQREAREAAERYEDVNAACPYPFSTDAAHAFKAYFVMARQEREALLQREQRGGAA
jgi:hypothetical protein